MKMANSEDLVNVNNLIYSHITCVRYIEIQFIKNYK